MSSGLSKSLDHTHSSCYNHGMNDHASWHPEVFLQNRYTRAYRSLMEWAQSQNRVRELGKHAEHHIVPESFFKKRSRLGPSGWLDGSPDAPENLVILTHNEHAWAHVLLSQRMTDGEAKKKMDMAITLALINPMTGEFTRRVSSRILAKIWSDAAVAFTERYEDPEFKQRHHTAVIESNSDLTVYHWRHVDGTTFIGTRADHKEAFNWPHPKWLNKLFGLKPMKSIRGWRAAIGEFPPSWRRYEHPTQRDHTVYHWRHVDGTTFIGTREEHQIAFNWPHPTWLKQLFLSKPYLICRGWSVAIGHFPDTPRPFAQPKLRDSVVYYWQHLDGTTFMGTREEHQVAFNWPYSSWLNKLFGSRPSSTANGWTVTPHQTQPKEHHDD